MDIDPVIDDKIHNQCREWIKNKFRSPETGKILTRSDCEYREWLNRCVEHGFISVIEKEKEEKEINCPCSCPSGRCSTDRCPSCECSSNGCPRGRDLVSPRVQKINPISNIFMKGLEDEKYEYNLIFDVVGEANRKFESQEDFDVHLLLQGNKTGKFRVNFSGKLHVFQLIKNLINRITSASVIDKEKMLEDFQNLWDELVGDSMFIDWEINYHKILTGTISRDELIHLMGTISSSLEKICIENVA